MLWICERGRVRRELDIFYVTGNDCPYLPANKAWDIFWVVGEEWISFADDWKWLELVRGVLSSSFCQFNNKKPIVILMFEKKLRNTNACIFSRHCFWKHKFEFKWIYQNSRVIISNNKLSAAFKDSYFKTTHLTDISYNI